MKTVSIVGMVLGVVVMACADNGTREPLPALDADSGESDSAADPAIEDPLPSEMDIDETNGDFATDSADIPSDQPLDAPFDLHEVTTDPAADPTEAGDSASGEDNDADAIPPYPEATTGGWVYEVDDSFWENMDDFVFAVLRDRSVSLYLSVFSANFFNNEAYRSLGMEIVRHPQSLFENAVIPLLERYGDAGVIWAVDCMNEPEALVAGSQGNWSEWGVSWDEMREYLGYCADSVHLHSALAVSTGSGWHDWQNIELGYYTGLGFDFLDFHYYSDAPAIPPVSTLDVTLPVIIGECGQSTAEWNDTLQLESTRDCFAQADSGGYLAALSWYYNYAGSSNYHSHLASDGSWRPVEAAFEEFADSSLIVGTNLAWFSGAYDHDMAINPLHPSWGVAYDHDTAVAVIEDLEDHDIPLLRFWVFEGGEALYYHYFFEDFEDGTARWTPLGDGISFRSSGLHVTDGDSSIAVHFDVDTTGWYGISVQFDELTPLNLAPAETWTYWAYNDLNQAVGVNLAFVVETDSESVTYQTRSGAGGGQLWLSPDQAGSKTVSLAEEGFASHWALATSPSVGAARPSQEELQDISEIRVRIYASDTQLPLSGDLYLDGVRIR